MNDYLTLETPEQIEINYDLARLGSRFIAASWDTLAIVTLQTLLGLGSVFIFAQLGNPLDSTFTSYWIMAVLILLSFLLLWGYYLIFELIWYGQTPGKRLAGIRTVRRDGYPIGFRESAIRNLVRIIDFSPVAYTIGTVVMFIDRESRRLGDFAAGTIVVHERSTAELKTLRSTTTVDHELLDPPIPNLDRLSLDEIEATRRFLQRRSSLVNSEALGNHLATRFCERLELESLPFDNIQFLRRVVAQYSH